MAFFTCTIIATAPTKRVGISGLDSQVRFTETKMQRPVSTQVGATLRSSRREFDADGIVATSPHTKAILGNQTLAEEMTRGLQFRPLASSAFQAIENLGLAWSVNDNLPRVDLEIILVVAQDIAYIHTPTESVQAT
jgi:hypothetical protein